jgi:hypothetical protein
MNEEDEDRSNLLSVGETEPTLAGITAPGIETEEMPKRILAASTRRPNHGIPTVATSRSVVLNYTGSLTVFMCPGRQ